MLLTIIQEFCYWTFIEKYYPNYYSCNKILLSDILTRKLIGEGICVDDEEYIKGWNVSEVLLELEKELLNVAFENYFYKVYHEKIV